MLKIIIKIKKNTKDMNDRANNKHNKVKHVHYQPKTNDTSESIFINEKITVKD
jgi:hypothetical protein